MDLVDRVLVMKARTNKSDVPWANSRMRRLSPEKESFIFKKKKKVQKGLNGNFKCPKTGELYHFICHVTRTDDC